MREFQRPMKINRMIFKLTWKIIIFNCDHFAKFIENLDVITSLATALEGGNQMHLRGVKTRKKSVSEEVFV